MPKHRLKLIIWAALVLAGILALVVALRMLGEIVSSTGKGADPGTALNIVPNVPPSLSVSLSWMADDSSTGRSLDPNTRDQIAGAYLRALLHLDESLRGGDARQLMAGFTGPALESARAAQRAATANGRRIVRAEQAHELELTFYSADGSVAALRDRDVPIVEVSVGPDGRVEQVAESVADYDVIMTIVEGNWLVRHLTRTAIRPVDTLPIPANPPPGFVAARGESLVIDGAPFTVSGFGYYPRETPWRAFWPAYDPATTESDFRIARGLGATTLRIFIPFDEFGGADVDPARIDDLRDLLDRATENDLRIIVTLFDGQPGFTPADWAAADRHLEAIVPAFAAHSAILAWDLKNAPDLDYGADPAWDQAWLRHAARAIRTFDPNHLVTIGWSSPEAAAAMPGLTDLVSFQYDAPAADLPGAIALLRDAEPGAPLLLAAFGRSTRTMPLLPGGGEQEQAAYMAAILAAVRAQGIAGSLAWTLNDFASVPAEVAGFLPWRRAPLAHMGVLRLDGSEKPAAALQNPGADLAAVPAPSAAQRWLTPFRSLAAAVLLALAAAISGGLAGARRRRRADNQGTSQGH